MKKAIVLLLVLLAARVSAQTSDSVRAVFGRSYTYETNRQYERAAGEIEKIYDGKSYEQNLRLGWLYYEAGRYKDALDYYQRAIQLHPSSVEALLGSVYPLTAQTRWDDVLKTYLAVLSIDSKNSTVNYRTGLIYFNRKNYSEAKKYLNAVLELYPFDYDSNVLNGWNEFYLENKALAKESFERALLYSPSDASALDGLRRCQ